LLQSIWL